MRERAAGFSLELLTTIQTAWAASECPMIPDAVTAQAGAAAAAPRVTRAGAVSRANRSGAATTVAAGSSPFPWVAVPSAPAVDAAGAAAGASFGGPRAAVPLAPGPGA